MSDLFSLQSPDAEPRENLAVFLHGWGSDERDLAALSGYLPIGLPWASLRAPMPHPAGVGYSWYPLDEGFSPAADIEKSTAAIWAWIDANVPTHIRLVPIGFSQGAMMASQLLRTRPERIGATVALSGYVSMIPQVADAALVDARPRVFWGRGDQDQVIPPDEVEYASEWFEAHTSVERHVYQGMAHNVNDAELTDIRQFLDRTLG